MTVHNRLFRNRLLIGASLATLTLAGTVHAQNFGERTAVDPAVAAAQAAQKAASQNASAQVAAERTRASLQHASRLRAQMDAAQKAAREAALAAQANIPNGLGQDGLQPAPGIQIDPSLWTGAKSPTQSQGANGRTQVIVDQTQDKAILTWDSFNVGRETDLTFDHHGNSHWISLNRVLDPGADPSRILGTIKAEGAVYLINRNGIIFGGASQVNVRNLIASTANITNEQFRDFGIHMREVPSPNWWEPPIQIASFKGAEGAVKVEAGARIATSNPATVVESGGYVMLLGSEVENAGTIVTDRGQAILAAGDDFLIRPGFGTDVNQASTTRGQEIAVEVGTGSDSGRAVNSGLIEARQGDITIAGEHVVQDGIAIATTNVHARGTIHLLTNVRDGKGDTSVTLTKDSLTLILPELDSKETATNAQREALVNPLNRTSPSLLNNQGSGNAGFLQPDRLDQSRVEIMTGGTALFEGGSHTIAQGGQIAVTARKRTFVGDGAVLDVSGVRGVAMDMESNSLMVNLQPYEMRDSGQNREVETLKHNNIWIDVRDLVLLPSGTGGHDGDRYYTEGGLIEVGGHLGNVSHKIGEWSANAGSITFTSGHGILTATPPDAGELIIQKGAILDISGGSLDYAAGLVRSTLFMGSDGKLYASGEAPAGVKLVAVGNAHVRKHERWGEAYTEVYTNPFSRVHVSRWEEGYTVGRDAGTLALSVPTLLMEGTVIADVIVGDRQTNARPDLPVKTDGQGNISGALAQRLDGYKLPQNVVPLAGGLYVGNRLHVPPVPGQGGTLAFKSDVTLSEGTDVTSGMTVDSVLAPDVAGNMRLSLDAINAAGLGALRITGENVRVESDLTVGNGGSVAVQAVRSDIQGDIVARSGTISIEALPLVCSSSCDSLVTDIKVADGVTFDTTGLWVNLKTGGDRRNLAHLDGGDVFVQSRQGSLRLGEGSLIDASAGGAIMEDGSFTGASGGDVALATGPLPRANLNQLVLGGSLRSYGSGDESGGSLFLMTGSRSITIGEQILGGGDILVAGQELPIEAQLQEAVTLPAGTALAFDFLDLKTKLFGGDTIGTAVLVDFVGLTTAADWTVPEGAYVYDQDFNSFSGGMVVPAGVTFGYGSITFEPGTVPADIATAFPGGLNLSVPLATKIPAGTVLAADIVIPMGATLERGWKLPVDAKIAAPLHLDTGFFQQGFSDYDVRAGGDMLVRGNTPIEVNAPVRRVTADSFAVASGAAPGDAMELWLPPMFREDAANGRFIQREGASLRLTASGQGDTNRPSPYGGTDREAKVFGSFHLGADTALRVDDGQSISVMAADRMLIEGRIEARGGSIDLMAGPAENMNRLETSSGPILYDATRAIWLESGSVIDASGRALTAVDNRGLRYGHVSAGGDIHVGGQLLQPRGLTAPRGLTSAYVVVREGALLDASGASAEVDYLESNLPEQRRNLLLATDGGRIAFDSQYGVFLDGTMRAHAGGAGALGGELSVALTTPILFDHGATGFPRRAVPIFMRRLRSVIVDQTYQSSLGDTLAYGDCIAGCWTPGQTLDESEAYNAGKPDIVGQARIGADQVQAGGFDSLTLKSDDVVLFDGDITLNLGRNLTLAGSIGNFDVDAHVNLSAAYVNFAGGGTMWGNDITYQNPGMIALGKRPDIGSGSLTITGGLVDMAGIRFGVNGSIGLMDGEQLEYEYAAPKEIHVISRSDIRLTGGEIRTLSNIDFTAAQIYPVTGASATILAGIYSYRLPNETSLFTTMMKGGTVSFHRLAGSTDAAPPLSLYGQVTVGADIINQGGVLRAPLGRIALGMGGSQFYPGPEMAEPGQTGWGPGTNVTTSEVNLLPGSLTSVSAKGLNIPYGGTTDGLSWTLNGQKIDTTLASQGVTVVGSLRADQGSVLDLSGGGMPTGAGFIPGRGGSVDILQTALANVNPGYRGLSHPDNKVYAIVPAYQNSAAPKAIDGHAQPDFGRQIIVPEGIDGLKAGTYMLLPAEYALMEGAYRVEMGKVTRPGSGQVTRLPDGSVALGVHTNVAHMDVRSATPVDVILTPSKVVRTHSQYDETSFEDFLLKRPATALFDRPAPLLPRDGKEFLLALATPEPGALRPAFSFAGTGLFAPAEKGLGGSLALIPGNYGNSSSYELEILADGARGTDGNAWIYASDLNAVGARMMVLGGRVTRGGNTASGQSVDIMAGGGFAYSYTGFGGIRVRDGAKLSAGQIFLVSDGNSDIRVERGATLSTVGKGGPAFDSTMGFNITNSNANILSVSNGLLELPVATNAGTTGQIVVEDGASLYSDGTMSFVSNGPVSLGQAANYGARYLSFSTGSVNIGTAASLDAAAAGGILPGGIGLTQSVLERLMLGDTSAGAPAVERLILSANQSINFYGSVDLDTRGPGTGKSAMQLVLNTPALYGHGTDGDSATISTGTLVWNGLVGGRGDRWNKEPISALPGGVIANGPGTGSGALNFVADRIVLGYQDGLIVPAETALDRIALGFANVNLTASERIESNHRATISVWKSQADYGKPGTGGNLNLVTPLLTGVGDSKVSYVAGGDIRLTTPQGYVRGPDQAKAELGAEIHLKGASIYADTAIALPSGRLVLTATGDLTLGDNARIDMAGRATDFFEEKRYSWGGDVELESTHGDIRIGNGAAVDLSADYNHAGTLKLTALEGHVAVDGTIRGAARNGKNPADPALRNGSIDIRAGTLADFAALNKRLTENSVTEKRSFLIKTGDLVIGDEVKARHVSIAADGGDLTVTGRIDASGAKPGSIRLSARDDLTLTGTAVLDARGFALQVDSYGAPIEATNRATVELTSAGGTLHLENGSTIDLVSPDKVNRGRIELNAARVGANDVAIDAGGALTISGAHSLSVNAFRTYQPSDGTIDQALLDAVHVDSDAFINAAIGNGALLDRMAGLRAYGDAFHFRPGVELTSAPGGSLRVSGDLNMAGYRYASLNPQTQRASNYADPLGGGYGSGEAGVLLIRAADDLDIHGSITDGFGMPARTPDDNGWVLYPGGQGVTTGWLQDYKVPVAVKLGAGAQFPTLATLEYDIPVDGFQVQPGFALGAETRLAEGVVLEQDWTATADIRLPDGRLIGRGTIVGVGTELPADTILGAGTVLPMLVSLQAMTWPKGVALPATMTLSGSTQVQAGQIIPRDSVIQLDGLFGLVRETSTLTSPYTLLGDPSLGGVTTFPGGANSTAVLDFDIMIRQGTELRRGEVIPFGFESSESFLAISSGWVPTAPIWADKAAFDAGRPPLYAAGVRIYDRLDSGAYFGKGTLLPRTSSSFAGTFIIGASRIPAGTPLNLFETVDIALNQNITVPAGTVIPAGVNIQPAGGVREYVRPFQADGTQGRIWAVAPMLKEKSQSWSMRFVAGADIGSADGRALRAASELANAGQSGDLTLSDRHYLNPQASAADGLDGNWLTSMRNAQQFSVLRTGTGSLDLLAGGSYEQLSLFGVYTAGSPTADIGGTTLDGYNAYNLPRGVLSGSTGLANPWIGAHSDGYADSIRDYRAWYPDHGGDLLLSVQGNLTGYATSRDTGYPRPGSGNVTNWLWRQGAYGVSEAIGAEIGQDVPTAWWVHFGGYVPNAPSAASGSVVGHNLPLLVGFMGIGTLGGGNLTVSAGGDAGMQQDWSIRPGDVYADRGRGKMAGQGLDFAVASTGRVTEVTRAAGFVTGGKVVQTGGGDIDIRIGGTLNPMAPSFLDDTDVAGTIANLRGDTSLIAGGVGRGTIKRLYADAFDPRLSSSLGIIESSRHGGITLVPGDGTVHVNARGVLNIVGVGDPGSIRELAAVGVAISKVEVARTVEQMVWAAGNGYGQVAGAPVGSDYIDWACAAPGQCEVRTTQIEAGFARPDGQLLRSSFTLWHDDTAIHLFSAGGDISPVGMGTGNATKRDLRYWYPPILTATAPHGNIQWVATDCGNDCREGIPTLELLPSPQGQVEFLAGGSILSSSKVAYDGVGDFPATMPIVLSGMSNSPELLPNPFRPVWSSELARTPLGSPNEPVIGGNRGLGDGGTYLAFQTDTAAGNLLDGQKPPALFYATGGDILRLSFGAMSWQGQTPIYMGSGSADIRASRDIVHLGTVPALGCGNTGPLDCRGTTQIFGGPFLTAGLVVHNDPRDITHVSAGRDIIYANMTVAGPGNLIVEAGRNVYQADQGRLTSVGPLFDLTPATRNGGAGITILTGAGAGGPDYDAFTDLYLNPLNQADPAYPLVHEINEGKVAKTYQTELTKWLSERYGYDAESPEAALEYFKALKPMERGIFVRQAYYDELKAGGREYNDTDGPRFGSYLRGRNAIAVLFPEKDASGKAISYAGDLTMFGGSGVRTLFGGNVELMVAGGQTLVGVGGIAPPSTAGILSMGSGDIDIYSLGSVLLGQSRVFTTFGGDLLMWSAAGDINAGRGSKSTAVYQPPRRVYDEYGNVTLSPPTQNTGAGIATLAPIPEIPAGDVDLIAPLGTIDAGEAGIRVSGNVNLAALQVLNAANIEVKGDATGIPMAVVVDTGALTAASSAAGAVTNQAAELAERSRPKIRPDIPTIITARFVGFGE